ncbi:response regulator transcription factor [Paenibacillus alkaliterrae]|uniref:response regulator transcription factor n=1 Tax=Paenibacillus alkaliterrae TaxID=320909 RepID=UPI001F37DBB8|nr:response regulator transcription factor [Paenibacillus alkaliterrae]MCF2941448.1 response regulator transcription factor [Paenibacillus alkaliterrae]
MSRILVVEDEEKIREVIVAYLLKAGFETCEASDGHYALLQLKNNDVDLIVLDLMLPDIGGEVLCNQIRALYPVPIIMLTAKSSMNHRVQGFAAGADDYIVKPFDPHELIARIRAVLRRTNQQELLADRLEYADGRLIVDSNKQQVFINQMPVSLTPNEYKLLTVMARNPERTFTREELIEKIMGYDFNGDARTIDQHIKNLRQKIEEDPKNPKHIQTVFGLGYRFHGGAK